MKTSSLILLTAILVLTSGFTCQKKYPQPTPETESTTSETTSTDDSTSSENSNSPSETEQNPKTDQ